MNNWKICFSWYAKNTEINLCFKTGDQKIIDHLASCQDFQKFLRGEYIIKNEFMGTKVSKFLTGFCKNHNRQ